MDMEYFDKEGNEPGNLSERLAKDCSLINILVTNYLSAILSSSFSFVIGITIAFFASWRLALVTLAVSPVLILSGAVEGFFKKTNEEIENTEDNNVLTETLNNIKMVKSLNAEKELYQNYLIKMKKISRKSIKKNQWSNLLFSIA